MSVRLPFIVLVALCVHGGAVAAPVPLAGIVVDQSGRAVPRARVRIVEADGTEASSGFADEAGRFALAHDTTACRVEASLTGFEPATAPCAAGAPIQITLAVAPLEASVLVSATRTEAPASQTGASATVFTAADLVRAQKPLVADLLAATPGAMVVRSGGPGTVASLFVRGGESDYNKILIDGVPLNEPGGTYYLSNLTTENLDRVEVVRGAYSSLFGSDAMGSVVQLFTRRGATRRPAVAAQIDGGTYGTLHASGNLSGAAGRADYSLGGARWRGDSRVPNSRFENTTFNANVGVPLGADATLRVVARGDRGRVGTPGQTAFGRPDLDAFFERHDSIGSVSVDQQIGRLRQRATYSIAASSQQSTDLAADPPFRAAYAGRTARFPSSDFTYDSLTRLRRRHASYQADIQLGDADAGSRHLLTLLADWDGERADVADRMFGTRTINTRGNFGVAAQQQMLWRRVSVAFGGRLERNASFGVAAVPRASIVYVARESGPSLGSTQLEASIGSGIKEPTMLESFSASPFFLGNPDLEPERSRSVEIGIRQRFARDRASVELTWFHNRYRDVITLVTTDPSTFAAQFSNVGETRARGIELGFETRPVDALRLRAGYTWLDSRIVRSERPDDALFGLGREAFRRPRHSGFVDASLAAGRLGAGLLGTFVGSFVDSDFGLFDPPLTRNPGHALWDARLSLTLTPRLTAIMNVDNLTGRDYSEPLGYQPLLRAVRAGVRLGF
ncbi:MAG: TonB-dependent receptor [Acidobacteria bacterium]|nr:TonB-dependent receptor [Acidobacteriota bacterium]